MLIVCFVILAINIAGCIWLANAALNDLNTFKNTQTSDSRNLWLAIEEMRAGIKEAKEVVALKKKVEKK